MNASEYREVFSTVVAEPLIQNGWVQHARNLLCKSGINSGGLLEVRSKYSSLGQSTRYLLVFRHTFLRDLDGEVPDTFPMNVFDYPVKLAPSNCIWLYTQNGIAGWHYTPMNLGIDAFDEIAYGTSTAEAVEPRLQALREAALQMMPLLSEYFSPQRAVEQIQRYGENAYCERMWLEDYRKFLAG